MLRFRHAGTDRRQMVRKSHAGSWRMLYAESRVMLLVDPLMILRSSELTGDKQA